MGGALLSGLLAVLMYAAALIMLLQGRFVLGDHLGVTPTGTVFEGLALYLLAASLVCLGLLALLVANVSYQRGGVGSALGGWREDSWRLFGRYWPLTLLVVVFAVGAFTAAQAASGAAQPLSLGAPASFGAVGVTVPELGHFPAEADGQQT